MSAATATRPAPGSVRTASPASSTPSTGAVLIGVDAGTSVMKAVAFDACGAVLATRSRFNRYASGPGGAVTQDMRRTADDLHDVLGELAAARPDLAARTVALAVTGQGDGHWLADAAGEPVDEAWLWLDGRAREEARAIAALPGYPAIRAATGTAIHACLASSQLRWRKRHAPASLRPAASAFHCKDWLYFQLTGERATDPSEAVLTFGSVRTRDYADEVIRALGLGDERHLLPPIVDGVQEAHPLRADAARRCGLPAGLPVTLGYNDVVCTSLGGGLYAPDARAPPGFSIVGTTGMHMVLGDATHAAVPEAWASAGRTGYTMCFPDGGHARVQSNMAATLNIDWFLDLMVEAGRLAGAEIPRAVLLQRLDALVDETPPGTLLYHPYISRAGERGPFLDADARASFIGLDTSSDVPVLARAIIEGLAMSARECYDAMGVRPAEIRLGGGAARSSALRRIFASVLQRPVRTLERAEAGAAGACMMAAVRLGLYRDLRSCAAVWVEPRLGEAAVPDASQRAHYDGLYDAYRRTRSALAPGWSALAGLDARR